MNYNELRASESQGNWEAWMRAVLRAGKILLLLLVVAAVYLYFYNPLDKQMAMRFKLEQLQAERDELKSSRDKLLRRMEWIKSDNAYLEMAARDRLHLQKEGEFVLRFE